MEKVYVPNRDAYQRLNTQELREKFLVESLFASGRLQLTLTDLDRAVVGSAVPTEQPLTLETPDALKADYFCERRELGALNIGGEGVVTVDGTEHPVRPRDILYVGRGAQNVSFASDKPGTPAAYYLVSFPAHTSYPTQVAKKENANDVHLGGDQQSSKRTIHQYIHDDGVPSCQLVMGYTDVYENSVWNTMPAHTHERRCEIYMYFDVGEGHQVLHMMGEPRETRPLWMKDREAVLSPPWSIHCGAATTSPYCFAWAMGGENKAFADMDGIAITDLK